MTNKFSRESIHGTLHILVLIGFAVAQPLYDLLSKNVEFFVARHSEPIDIILLALLLTAVPAAVFLLIDALVGLFHKKLRVILRGLAVFGLSTVIVFQVIKHLISVPSVYLISGSIVGGFLAASLYLRFRSVRAYLTVLSPAILIFPALFLFGSPVRDFIFPQSVSVQGTRAKIGNPVPVVLVIFDELPVTSLMNENRQIDPVRYPNFAALAEDTTWFRNATTTAVSTGCSVSTIVSGKLPHVQGHPQNLFTLLSGSYNLNVYESVTELCPAQICERIPEPLTSRMRSLLNDLAIVYLHVLLPDDLGSRLPSIASRWSDFQVQGEQTTPGKKRSLRERSREATRRREKDFYSLVANIKVEKVPSLFFVLTQFPHDPYDHFPSGTRYSEDDGLFGLATRPQPSTWRNDEWAVIQSYQRHLLQVGFVDTLLGKLIGRLKEVGLYDRSLLIVTADHGARFRAGDYRRDPSETNFQDIMSVPLLIKVPNQHQGVFSDRNVQSIDILPTIADVLKIKLPWSVDGQSVLNLSLPEPEIKFLTTPKGTKGGEKPMEFKVSELAVKYETLKRKLTLFGSGPLIQLFKIGKYGYLVGKAVAEVGVAGESGATVSLKNKGLFSKVDLESGFIPAKLTGSVSATPSFLAVAINGVIRAVTQTFSLSGHEKNWAAVVDERSFKNGHNDVEVFIISESFGRSILLKPQGSP